MGGEWRTQTFSELIGGRSNVIGGPFGSNLTQADYTLVGVPVIRGSNMGRAGRYLGGEYAFVAAAKAEQLASNQVREGDIVVTQRGTMGQVSIVPLLPSRRYVVSQSQMGVRVQGADPMFVYYLLRSSAFREFLEGATIQTGVPHINMGLLREWKVIAPSMREQACISGLLATLDDRIELNRRMAETLEAMAKALFKSWFVDFDPVHARTECRPISLRDDLAALFPDGFGDDGVPRGWNIRTVGDLFEVSGGNTPSTEREEFWGGAHHWASPKDLSSLSAPVLLRTARKLTDAGLTQASSGPLPAGSLLLSSRAPIGYTAFTTAPTAINQGFAGIVRKETSTAYAWAWCHAYMDMIKANAGGSTFAEISKSVFRKLPMLAPSRPVLDAFGHVADALIERVVAAVQQQEVLADLRDTLIPQLISGELQITNAEQRIAAA